MESGNVVEKALGIRAFYHKLIAGNISNVDTPGYREKDIDFKAELQRKLESPADVRVSERSDGDGLNTIDGNTVNIEKQMVKLTENTLMYNTLVQIINKNFTILRYAVRDGR
jgi:flagellar basal-body rod protein FlgB